jgi:hypothetical protein
MLEDVRKKFVADGEDHLDKNAYLALMLEGKDGELVYKILGNGPCHGSLQIYNLANKVTLPIKYILSAIQTHNYKDEYVLPYIDWLLNRSPWADVFVDKDVKSVYKYGWLIGTDQPSNLVASACIATRYFTETYTPQISRRYETYLHILSLGFSEHESMLMSYLFEKDKGKKYLVNFRSLECSHSVFAMNRAPESYYRNFLNDNPKGCQTGSFKSRKGYDGEIHALWKSSGGSSSDAFFSWIQNVRPIDSKAKKSLNIFEKIETKGFTITSEEGFKSVITQVLKRINDAK